MCAIGQLTAEPHYRVVVFVLARGRTGHGVIDEAMANVTARSLLSVTGHADTAWR